MASKKGDVVTIVGERDSESANGGHTSDLGPTARLNPDHRQNPRVSLASTQASWKTTEESAATSGATGIRVEDITDDHEGLQTARIVGELDLSTAISALRQLLDLLDSGEGVLVVDLAGLSFINSSGLLVLEGASRYALEKRRLISFIHAWPLAHWVSSLGGSESLIIDGATAGSSGDIGGLMGVRRARPSPLEATEVSTTDFRGLGERSNERGRIGANSHRA
jgi:anti-anti-sigma regulatory factor